MSVQPALARHRFISVVSCVLLLASTILLLLVSVSSPILKPVYLASIESILAKEDLTSATTELRFGVWGLCATSVPNQTPRFSSNAVCFGPMLGYDIPSDLTNLAGVPPLLSQAVDHSLLLMLVLHPVTAGLSFIGFVFSFFLGPQDVAIFTLVVTILAGILGIVVFASDVALVIVLRNAILSEAQNNLEVVFGPGTWMVLAAVAMIWLTVIFLSARACYCCGVTKYYNYYQPQTYQPQTLQFQLQ